MTESVYKVIELVGTSSESWEKAAATAVEKAAQSLRDLRIAEIVELDMQPPARVVGYQQQGIPARPLTTCPLVMALSPLYPVRHRRPLVIVRKVPGQVL